MKWAIIILILIMIPSALGLEMCQDTIRPYEPCMMASPTLSCSVYNYTIYHSENGSIAQNGNLTNLNADFYYFNFTLGVGDYLVRLCDLSSREIKVESEDNMLAIILGMAIMILILGGIGYLNFKVSNQKIGFWVGVFSFTLAIIEAIMIIGLLFAKESGLNIVPLLELNFYIMLILGFGVFLISIVLLILNIMNFNDKKQKWDNKWQG